MFGCTRNSCLSAPRTTDDAFYLQTLQSPTDKCWYSRQPLGHNTLQKIVPDICQKAGVKGYKTNHSLRVTTATRLHQAGVSESLIMERTGHRSVTGVRSYTRTSGDQKAMVNAILNDEPVEVKPETVPTTAGDNTTTSASTSSAMTPPPPPQTGQQIRIENCIVNFKKK